jgi:hypothetical protein
MVVGEEDAVEGDCARVIRWLSGSVLIALGLCMAFSGHR